MSPKNRITNMPSSPSLLARPFLHQLALQGVKKLSASHLEVVAKLDAEWNAGAAGRATRVLATRGQS